MVVIDVVYSIQTGVEGIAYRKVTPFQTLIYQIVFTTNYITGLRYICFKVFIVEDVKHMCNYVSVN